MRSSRGVKAPGRSPSARWRLGSRGVLGGLALLGLLAALRPGDTRAAGEDELYGEYQVKAAFLLNFAKFVDWPSGSFRDAASPVTFCVIGPDPFEGALETTLHKRTVGGRPLDVRRLPVEADPAGCQVLFVPAGAEAHLSEILKHATGRPILTVGETEPFQKRGGVIRFVLEQSHVRFIVNTAAAGRANLTISAKLLSIAREVIDREEAAP